MAECLQERGLSEADTVLQKKADGVRERRATEAELEHRRQREAFDRQKEAFERAAKSRIAPMADRADVLGQIARAAPPQKEPEPKRRRPTRLFLKAAVYSERREMDDDDQRVSRLNPHMPPVLIARVRSERRYPDGCPVSGLSE
jgi:hypothetical protein